MSKKLDRFELGEQIDAGGFTTVYRAVEDMGQGILRPVAIKVLPTWKLADADQLAILRREVEVLIELGGAPNIVSILATGIDEEMGAWIAMELAGKSLKHSIGEGPAEPDQVRVLLRDSLKGLICVHGTDPQILHRDLKPQNILGSQGSWKVTDFGLAKRGTEEETMSLATVKYAAPELLDSSLGEESPRLDIYALGMVAYEFALGTKLFNKQFPSIHDPAGGAKKADSDDRPKWMYWHTSYQMTLTPLAELVEGYPQDLSDLVTSMTTKPPAQRIATAEEAMARLGEVNVSAPTLAHEEPDDGKKSNSVSPIIATAAAIAVVVALVGGLIYFLIAGRPKIELASSGLFVAANETISVTGTIENFPEAGRAEVQLRSGNSRTYPVTMAAGGLFTCEVKLRELGTIPAVLTVKDPSGSRVARASFDVVRVEPEAVDLVVTTSPPVRGATVTVRGSGGADEAVVLTTDANGEVKTTVPFGEFTLEAFHARHHPLARQTVSTGIDPIWKGTAQLVALDFAALQAEMLRDIDRLMRLMKRKVDCPPGPLTEEEEWQVTAYVTRLRQLADGDEDIELFLISIESVKECDPTTMVSAPDLPAEGGPDADPAEMINKIIARIERLVDRKVTCPPGPLSELEEKALKNALDELAALAVGNVDISLYIDSVGRVKDCDPSSRPTDVPSVETRKDRDDRERRDREIGSTGPAVAINQIIARVERLIDRKVTCPPGPLSDLEEQALTDALVELSTLAAGNIDIELYVDSVKRVKDCDPSSRPKNVPKLETEEERLSGTGEEESSSPTTPDFIPPGGQAPPLSGTEEIIKGAQGKVPPNPELVRKLKAMPLDEFASFVRSNVPTGAIKVEMLEDLNQVRVSGALFSDSELERMIIRLAYGMGRIQPELRVDAWEVSRKLGDALTTIKATGVQVDAYQVPKDPTLFVQYQSTAGFDGAKARVLASTYVVDQGLLWVRGYQDQPAEEPDRSEEGGL
jgi:serine/threonine protein kinase